MTHSGEMLSAYMSQLTPMEQKVLRIAASHLETSFSLVKSIGFQEWQQTQVPKGQQTQVPKGQQTQVPKQAEQHKEQVPAPEKKKIRIKLKSSTAS